MNIQGEYIEITAISFLKTKETRMILLPPRAFKLPKELRAKRK